MIVLKNLLAKQRRDKIVELLIERESVKVSELKEMFGVTLETIRQDLLKLEKEGIILKEHGGAVLNKESLVEISFAKRIREHASEKRRIGIAAAKIIKNGETVILDSGTTTSYIAKNITSITNLTVITPSLKVASELGGKEGITVLLAGGIFNPLGFSVYGPQTERFFEEINADKLFLAIHGADTAKGLTEISVHFAHLKQIMMSKAREIILVADSSKIGKVEYAFVAPLTEVETIITDKELPEDKQEEIRKLGINLILT